MNAWHRNLGALQGMKDDIASRAPKVLKVYRTYVPPKSDRSWGWYGFAMRGLASGAVGVVLLYAGWRMSRG